MYCVGSFHSIYCFNYLHHISGWNYFFFSSRSVFPSCLSLHRSLSMLITLLPSSYIYIYAQSRFSSSFGSKFFCYHSLIHGSSLRLLPLLIFNPNSSQELCNATWWLFPIFNLILFRLFTIDNIFHHRFRHDLILPLTNLRYTVTSNTMYLLICTLTNLLSILIITFLNRNLFPIFFLMVDLVYHFKRGIISLTSEHVSLLKSWPCINYIHWFVYTLPFFYTDFLSVSVIYTTILCLLSTFQLLFSLST